MTDRKTVLDRVAEEKIIVIVRGVKKEKMIPLAEAMYRGGIRLLEVTYAADRSVPWEETAGIIRDLKEHFGDKMSIGAGTVLYEEQAELTAKAGGEFVISPDTRENVIKKTRELGLVSMPGALTPTECQTAHLAGADYVKLFPISNFGAGYLSNLRAPLSHIRFLAVGGIIVQNIPEYLKAGACGFGIGGSIVNKTLINEEKWDEITAIAKEFTAAAKG